MKRADTSDTRPAPLVTTIMLMIIRITKTNSPTAKLPPTRKAPKLSITLPGGALASCPFTSTIRVEATLSASRSRVANSSTDGKDEKSSGFVRVQRRHQDADRKRDVEHEEDIQHAARDRQHHQSISARMPDGSASAAALKGSCRRSQAERLRAAHRRRRTCAATRPRIGAPSAKLSTQRLGHRRSSWRSRRYEG